MTRDPILAVRSLPKGTDGYREPLVFKVEGGLCYLRGSHAPYFSLTYTQHRKGFPSQCYSGGAGHEAILAYFPRFADLAALHLSDIDGVPMHAEANGWYWLAGAAGNAMASPIRAPEAADECLAIFARHCRISIAEAEAIRDECIAEARENPDGWQAARATMELRLADMRPRWKAEAEAAIQHHHLTVFGDPWPPETLENER